MSSPLRSSTPTCPTPRTTPTTPLPPQLSTLLLLSRQLHQWPTLLLLSTLRLLLSREASTTPRTMLVSTALGTTTEAL